MDEPLTIAYVYPGDKFLPEARRFVSTYQQFPPEYHHRTVILCNACRATDQVRELFYPVTVYFAYHDNSGWDIGAWLFYAKECKGVMLCLGTSVYFAKSGWLKRLADAWQADGPGLYGVSGSYEKRPHINTSAFMVDTHLLRLYAAKVVTKEDRYRFEHGENSFHNQLDRLGHPCKVVHWDGVYDQKDWRKPANIFRRGDQSNLLMRWNHTDVFDKATTDKARLSALADGLCISQKPQNTAP